MTVASPIKQNSLSYIVKKISHLKSLLKLITGWEPTASLPRVLTRNLTEGGKFVWWWTKVTPSARNKNNTACPKKDVRATSGFTSYVADDIAFWLFDELLFELKVSWGEKPFENMSIFQTNFLQTGLKKLKIHCSDFFFFFHSFSPVCQKVEQVMSQKTGIFLKDLSLRGL